MRISSELIVDLKQLKLNYNLLTKKAPKNEVLFMVKANAYGHGLTEIVKYSFHELKISKFGCASLGEALEIAETIDSDAIEIFVFSDLELNDKAWKNASNIIPVLGHMDQLDFVLENETFKHIPLVIKFDTGMHRLGISSSKAKDVIHKLTSKNRLEIKHLMTHFSTSFILLKDRNRTYKQYDKFKELKALILDAGITILETSVANSGAIEQNLGLEETHIRPGLMMYGPRSVGSIKDKSLRFWDGKAISKLKTKILKIEEVKRGTPIGYGAHVCHANGVIAYLPLGYGDGILTYYSGAELHHKGLTGKIIGRVNMDITAVLFENEKISNTSLKAEDDFYIWNINKDDVVDFAGQTKSIPYQIFTAITSRVPRRYIS